MIKQPCLQHFSVQRNCVTVQYTVFPEAQKVYLTDKVVSVTEKCWSQGQQGDPLLFASQT